MRVYLVHNNTCENYGYNAHVYGIYNTRDRCLDNCVSPTFDDMDIVEFELNKDTDVFLGGYEE